MELFYFISGVVSLILVICVFLIGANVATIKKSMIKPSKHKEIFNEYKKHLYFGDADKAKAAYKDFFWSSFLDIKDNPALNTKKKAEQYNALIARFSKLKEYGIDTPENYDINA